MGEQCIVVREVPGSKPRGGTPIFETLPFRGDSLETKKGAWELGLMFGTLKDGSLQINSLALNNCFSFRNVI